tara:strand:- start:308 stop:493 length:186 start_codon:yes stop_codon:yes gene_type:complete
MGKSSRILELFAIILLLAIGISMVNAYFFNNNRNNRPRRRIIERNIIYSPMVGQPRGRRQY